MIHHFSSFQIVMGTPHLWPAPAIQAPVAAVVPNREAALTLPQPFAPRNIRMVMENSGKVKMQNKGHLPRYNLNFRTFFIQLKLSKINWIYDIYI